MRIFFPTDVSKTDLKFYMYLFSYINCTIHPILCQGKIHLKIGKILYMVTVHSVHSNTLRDAQNLC